MACALAIAIAGLAWWLLGASSRVEEAAWSAAKTEDTLNAYEQFFKSFPHARHRQEAGKRVIELLDALDDKNFKQAVRGMYNRSTLEVWKVYFGSTQEISDNPVFKNALVVPWASNRAAGVYGEVLRFLGLKDEEAFASARKQGTLQAWSEYGAFVVAFPLAAEARTQFGIAWSSAHSREIPDQIRMLLAGEEDVNFDLAKKANTCDGWKRYVEAFEADPFTRAAREFKVQWQPRHWVEARSLLKASLDSEDEACWVKTSNPPGVDTLESYRAGSESLARMAALVRLLDKPWEPPHRVDLAGGIKAVLSRTGDDLWAQTADGKKTEKVKTYLGWADQVQSDRKTPSSLAALLPPDWTPPHYVQAHESLGHVHVGDGWYEKVDEALLAMPSDVSLPLEAYLDLASVCKARKDWKGLRATVHAGLLRFKETTANWSAVLDGSPYRLTAKGVLCRIGIDVQEARNEPGLPTEIADFNPRTNSSSHVKCNVRAKQGSRIIVVKVRLPPELVGGETKKDKKGDDLYSYEYRVGDYALLDAKGASLGTEIGLLWPESDSGITVVEEFKCHWSKSDSWTYDRLPTGLYEWEEGQSKGGPTSVPRTYVMGPQSGIVRIEGAEKSYGVEIAFLLNESDVPHAFQFRDEESAPLPKLK